jgi:hypothetical protein
MTLREYKKRLKDHDWKYPYYEGKDYWHWDKNHKFLMDVAKNNNESFKNAFNVEFKKHSTEKPPF